MATDPPGSKKDLSDGRTEALRALVNSLAPGESASAETPSKEDVSKLSDKLTELLRDVDPSQGGVRRNERGELLNDEGLPIVEITEPIQRVPESAPDASSGTGQIEDAEDARFVPMYRLPPAERVRNRAQMDRILDLLEEEERVKEERTLVRDREQRQEELERHQANAKAEFERAKAAKEMQKKMGKALLRNMADAREKEKQEKARQEQEDLEKEEERRARKPRKSVSWAELPKLEKSSARSGDDSWAGGGARSSGKLPMRRNVVERVPTRSGASSPPPPAPTGDSDDETDPPSPALSDSHAGESDHSNSVAFPVPDHSPSGSEDEDEPAENHGSEDEFDMDAMQHQREIALAYFEKRNTIGADAARAMSAHSHDLAGEDEWEQEDVPLEAMLAGPRPKPSQSKFRSERLAQAYGTRLPASTPPTSLGTSVVPNSTNALRSAVRVGRLEADRLVGNSDSDGEDDTTRTREFMDALYRGDVTNAGAAEKSDVLIAALESAYGGAPPNHHPPPAPAAIAAAEPVQVPNAPKTAPISSQKGSRFKPSRAAPPPTLAEDEGPREGGALPARPPPTSATVVERMAALPPRPSISPHPTASSASASPHVGVVGSLPAASQPPPMVVDSPSFAPPGGDATSVTVIHSPSFRPPLPSARPTHPPTVQASVRESSEKKPQPQQQTSTLESGQKVSRFRAQQQQQLKS